MPGAWRCAGNNPTAGRYELPRKHLAAESPELVAIVGGSGRGSVTRPIDQLWDTRGMTRKAA
jgi:hypothetical protein